MGTTTERYRHPDGGSRSAQERRHYHPGGGSSVTQTGGACLPDGAVPVASMERSRSSQWRGLGHPARWKSVGHPDGQVLVTTTEGHPSPRQGCRPSRLRRILHKGPRSPQKAGPRSPRHPARRRALGHPSEGCHVGLPESEVPVSPTERPWPPRWEGDGHHDGGVLGTSTEGIGHPVGGVSVTATEEARYPGGSKVPRTLRLGEILSKGPRLPRKRALGHLDGGGLGQPAEGVAVSPTVGIRSLRRGPPSVG